MRQQTLRDTPVRKPGGLKNPGPKLAELLERVNLIPPDTQLPFGKLAEDDYVATPVLLDAISKLRDAPALQAHLLELMHHVEQLTSAGEADTIAERHRPWYDQQNAKDQENFRKGQRLFVQNHVVRERYRLIHNARQTFRRFALLKDKVELTVPVPAELILEVDRKRGAFIKTHDPLLNRIIGERLDYIRVCPICGRIFFAGRVNQDACPEGCADALRQRRKREREKLKKQLAAQRAAKKVRKK